MGIPQQANFEELCSSITVLKPSNASGFDREIVVPASVAKNVGHKVHIPEQSLWFKPSKAISFEAIVVKIQKELSSRKHKATRQIALSFLAIVSLRRNPDELAVACLNRYLDLITECKVFQTFLFPPSPPPDFKMTLGHFCIQLLDTDGLQYRCKRARSDYFTKYERRLHGRLSIDRNAFEVWVVDLFDNSNGSLDHLWSKQNLKQTYESFIASYFELISRELERDFWSSFLEEQHVLIAAGAPYVDDRLLSQLAWTEMITVFLCVGAGNGGFVLPIESGWLTLNMGNADISVTAIQRMLEKEYDFKGIFQSDIHQTLRTYTRFMSKAERHVIDGRIDEGFLHYVISLDLLFGEKDSSTKSVSNRVSCLTHRALGKSFIDQLKQIQTIYDRRSKYVHEGQAISESAIDEIQAVCREVLWCLLRLQKDGQNVKDVSGWLSMLDYFVAATEAGRPVDDRELRQCGIATLQSPSEGSSDSALKKT